MCTSQGWLGRQGRWGSLEDGQGTCAPRSPPLPDWRDRPKGPRVWTCAPGTGGPGEGRGVHAGVARAHSMHARQAHTRQAPAHASQVLLPATGEPRTEGPPLLSQRPRCPWSSQTRPPLRPLPGPRPSPAPHTPAPAALGAASCHPPHRVPAGPHLPHLPGSPHPQTRCTLHSFSPRPPAGKDSRDTLTWVLAPPVRAQMPLRTEPCPPPAPASVGTVAIAPRRAQGAVTCSAPQAGG